MKRVTVFSGIIIVPSEEESKEIENAINILKYATKKRHKKCINKKSNK